MRADLIVSIVIVVGALVLAWRGLRAQPMVPGRRLTMALVWVVIIVGVVFLAQTLGLEVAR
ncbi:hypothetical protein ABVV53_03505 [Novosphingobium sp. RD2P27]|uniref:Uncharacterized protein n=1 Tax=Novosphingobium kalidii TaxID=3230299 RepID=A0ABV2CY55_9SPHN